MEFKHQTFTFDVRPPLVYTPEWHQQLESLVRDEYSIEEYLISYETIDKKGGEKPHFHFIVFSNYANVTNLIQKLVRDYKLSNTSGKRGGKRFYARDKTPIRNLELLKVYCSKEGNVLSSYSNEVLDELYRKSFLKDTQTPRDKCLAYVEETFKKQYYLNDLRLKQHIILWCMEQRFQIRKNIIDGYFMWIRQNSTIKNLGYSDKQILQYLYPFEYAQDYI